MLTEIVMVKLPDGMTRDEVISNFEATATTWRENPDLIRKNYVFDAASGVAGGVYLWKKGPTRKSGTVRNSAKRRERFMVPSRIFSCSKHRLWLTTWLVKLSGTRLYR